jgi:hypothetical protein
MAAKIPIPLRITLQYEKNHHEHPDRRFTLFSVPDHRQIYSAPSSAGNGSFRRLDLISCVVAYGQVQLRPGASNQEIDLRCSGKAAAPVPGAGSIALDLTADQP